MARILSTNPMDAILEKIQTEVRLQQIEKAVDAFKLSNSVLLVLTERICPGGLAKLVEELEMPEVFEQANKLIDVVSEVEKKKRKEPEAQPATENHKNREEKQKNKSSKKHKKAQQQDA